MKTPVQRALVSTVLLAAMASVSSLAYAATTLHVMWYSDGNEGQVVAAQIKDFEAKNPGINVVLDQVPYKSIQTALPVQLAAGQGPDIARVADLGGLAKYMLDLRPLLPDAAQWDANYGPFLTWMRLPGDTTSIHGYMTQLTITGPFVNKTLFEQAKVPMPGDKATWPQWAAAIKTVAAAEKVPYPIAADRSGHRVFGMILSQGAKVFDAQGNPAVVDAGFKAGAQMIYDWHQQGLMSKALWGAVSGATYQGANTQFANGQVVMYESGSWQISQFAKTVGTNFDWVAVPTPCGPANCSGMPGGAAVVGFKSTKHPKSVAKLLDYLASPAVISAYYGKTLSVPGNVGVAKAGVSYVGATPAAAAALKVFGNEVATLAPVAYKLQGYAKNKIVFDAVISRLCEAIVGQSTLDQAYARITSDIKNQIAAANGK